MITTEKGFNVICSNPEKAKAIDACWFSYEDWTEEAAMRAFCTEYNLDASEAAIDKED